MSRFVDLGDGSGGHKHLLDNKTDDSDADDDTEEGLNKGNISDCHFEKYVVVNHDVDVEHDDDNDDDDDDGDDDDNEITNDDHVCTGF